MSDKGLLEIAQRLVVDRDFREQFLIDPGTVLAEWACRPTPTGLWWLSLPDPARWQASWPHRRGRVRSS